MLVYLLSPRVVGGPKTSQLGLEPGSRVGGSKIKAPAALSRSTDSRGNLKERIRDDGIQPMYGGNGKRGL